MIIVTPESITDSSLADYLIMIERSLECFPEDLIKEITDNYLKRGISTQIVIKLYDNCIEQTKYIMKQNSANIYINYISNNINTVSYANFADGFIHEFAIFIRDYIFLSIGDMGQQELTNNFESLNNSYKNKDENFNKIFINKHSALNIKEEVSDLIWYAETHPNELRNIDSGKQAVIHQKLVLLSAVMGNTFNSITEKDRLWVEAIPGIPDPWAADIINNMIKKDLIPKFYIGAYEAYIVKEDFYVLVLNSIKNKIGDDMFSSKLNIVKQEKWFNIDPIKGEVVLEDGLPDVITSINKEIICEAYNAGFINIGETLELQKPITRLEAIKIFAMVCSKFDINIIDYNETNIYDLSNMGESDKQYVLFALNKGIIKGDGNNLNLNEYCTYQEVYLMLDRFYKLL